MSELEDKIAKWLQSEGYPLEFSVSRTLTESGFHVRHGEYARKSTEQSPRELDVMAKMDGNRENYLFRIVNLVECKYSDKPWVCFVSKRHRIANSACAAQTLASEYGEAMMQSVCGDKNITKMQLFNSPKEPCFGGRQAFTKGKDQFFDTLRSLSGNSIAVAERYNLRTGINNVLPRVCVLIFPIVVVQGRLFEAGLDDNGDETFVREVKSTRVHWRGSEDRSLFTTLDIVSSDSFKEFSDIRYSECEELLKIMMSKHSNFIEFADSGNIEDIGFSAGSSGITGISSMLKRIRLDAITRNRK